MFELGKIYNRRTNIHGLYKGQQYGGISTPSNHNYIFIFTGHIGNKYGYIDTFIPDGTFEYTGEGQEGDMKMSKGNLAIRDHQKNNKEILLFEYITKGNVRFLGQCNYLFHRIEERADKNGNLRNAIIFHLDVMSSGRPHIVRTSNTVEAPQKAYSIKSNKSEALQNLREKAIGSTPKQTTVKEKIQSIRERSEAIKKYAKKRAAGVCEGCNKAAPFETKTGPYLEVHHLTRLADGGTDLPQNVIALCPTCHRRAHHALNNLEFNNELIIKVASIESSYC